MSEYKVIGTYIEKEMYESNAFLSLTGIAPQLLILFLGKRFIKTRKIKKKKIRICTNCDNITFTYVEAMKKYGIAQKRFTRGRDQLIVRGFIRIKSPGGGYDKDKAIYAMSDQWRLWHPGRVVEKRPKVTTQKGFLNNPTSAQKAKDRRTAKNITVVYG